jgi:hypothetical protein
MRTLSGIGLFSATVLLFQVTLTRLFSIAQFYHFAFLVVSLATGLRAVICAYHRTGLCSPEPLVV